MRLCGWRAGEAGDDLKQLLAIFEAGGALVLPCVKNVIAPMVASEA